MSPRRDVIAAGHKKDDTFTDIPWAVEKAMKEQGGVGSEAAAKRHWSEVYDPEDVEAGEVVTPRDDQGMKND